MAPDRRAWSGRASGDPGRACIANPPSPPTFGGIDRHKRNASKGHGVCAGPLAGFKLVNIFGELSRPVLVRKSWARRVLFPGGPGRAAVRHGGVIFVNGGRPKYRAYAHGKGTAFNSNLYFAPFPQGIKILFPRKKARAPCTCRALASRPVRRSLSGRASNTRPAPSTCYPGCTLGISRPIPSRGQKPVPISIRRGLWR